MEHALTAPFTGTIKGLDVAEGDTVEQGRVLMSLTAEG